MKKKYAVLICAVFVAFCLSACAGLSGDIDEDRLREQSYAVISLIDAADYETLYAMLRSDVAEETTPAQMSDTFIPLLGDLGARQEYKRERFKTKTNKDTDEKYYFCQFTVMYENGAATYSVAFDLDYTLIGLSVIAR